MTNVKVANFYGGIPIKNHKEQLENDPPHVVVGTPGRIKQVGSGRSALRSPLLHVLPIRQQQLQSDRAQSVLLRLGQRGAVQGMLVWTRKAAPLQVFANRRHRLPYSHPGAISSWAAGQGEQAEAGLRAALHPRRVRQDAGQAGCAFFQNCHTSTFLALCLACMCCDCQPDVQWRRCAVAIVAAPRLPFQSGLKCFETDVLIVAAAQTCGATCRTSSR